MKLAVNMYNLDIGVILSGLQFGFHNAYFLDYHIYSKNIVLKLLNLKCQASTE